MIFLFIVTIYKMVWFIFSIVGLSVYNDTLPVEQTGNKRELRIWIDGFSFNCYNSIHNFWGSHSLGSGPEEFRSCLFSDDWHLPFIIVVILKCVIVLSVRYVTVTFRCKTVIPSMCLHNKHWNGDKNAAYSLPWLATNYSKPLSYRPSIGTH